MRTCWTKPSSRVLWLAPLLWLTACGEPQFEPCNGAAHLCARTFDQVAFACTHNAMSNTEDGWIGPNQKYPVARQLADGVRALMLDLHTNGGKVMLCHGTCGLGQKPLAEELKSLRAFLQANPREVVTLIFESYAKGGDVVAAFTAAGLEPLLHAQQAGAAWPTLAQMIDSGRRLVVLTDRGGGAAPWYHDVWAHAWETHWSNKKAAGFSCKKNRGKAGNALFILNHFLTNPVAMPLLAEQVNHNPLFIDRARQCQKESGRLPNFLTVDFYSIGDVLKVAAALNAQ